MAWTGLIAVLAALHAAAVHAVSSYDCKLRVHHPDDVDGVDPRCPQRGLCGTIPQSDKQFYSRLSPRCATLFESYRSDWSKAGVANIVSHHTDFACKKPGAITGASQPIVLATNDTATFVICTVPKAGCTNMRKLLSNMLLFPGPPLQDAFAQYQQPHVMKYPAVVLYNLTERSDPGARSATEQLPLQASRRLAADARLWQPEIQTRQSLEATPPPPTAPPWSRVPDGIPSFTFGRNPYVRLLSGFRDKMVNRTSRADQHTVGNVNQHLGLARKHRWPDTPESFREFVLMLFEKGVTTVDGHFRPSTEMCGGDRDLRFDYYLRLEEMAEWFPCWMDGLGLRGWTESGWSDSPHGRMYIGHGVKDKFVTIRSYGKRGAKVPRWDESKGEATFGERGVDWDLLSGDSCWWAPRGMTCSEYYGSFTAADGSVLPGGVPASPAVEEEREGAGRKRDTHDTDAPDSWKDYYDQYTADLAYLLYAFDFKVFGYERAVVEDWDASPAQT